MREEIVPGVNIVWLFKPEDIETMFRCEGKYPKRRSHLALEKYRLDRKDLYNNGGLLPTLVFYKIILFVFFDIMLIIGTILINIF